MTPGEISLIVYRLDEIAKDVGEVKELAKATNGRVRKLEEWKAKVEGALAAASSTKPVVVGVVCLLAGGAIERFVF